MGFSVVWFSTCKRNVVWSSTFFKILYFVIYRRNRSRFETTWGWVHDDRILFTMNQFKWIDSELDLLIWMLTWIECKWTDSKMYLIIYQIHTKMLVLYLSVGSYIGAWKQTIKYIYFFLCNSSVQILWRIVSKSSLAFFYVDFTLLLNLTDYDGCLVDSFNRKEQKIWENAFYYIVQSYNVLVS